MTPSEFFKALYRDATGYAEFRLIHHTGDWSQVKRLYRPAKEVHAGNFEALAELNEEYHIYHRVNVSATKASKKADISHVVALYIDVDNPSDEALARFQDMDLEPTAIVYSGGGFHGYWMLRTPLAIDSDKLRLEVERTQEGLALAYGDDADLVAKDVTRILRTPGYYNIKDKYDPKPLCEVVYCDDDDYGRYTFDELHKRYAPLGTPQAPKVRRSIPDGAMSKQLPDRVKTYLSGGASQGNRNHELFYCARAYNDSGYSESDALADLGTVARNDGLPDSEIKQCIRSAFSYSPDISARLPRHMKSVMAVEDSSKLG